MRAILILWIIGFPFLLYSQHIELTVRDQKSGEAIPYAHVVAIDQDGRVETMTNEEGRVKLAKNYDSLWISHIGYEAKKWARGEIKSTILYLTPGITEPASITVYGTNIREKIEYVLKHFNDLYVDGYRTYDCTYKETIKVSDSLARLMQFQLQWATKYRLDYRKSPYRQNHVRIGAVDYHRQKEGEQYGIYSSNRGLMHALHLYSYLGVLLVGMKDIDVQSITKTGTSTKIRFTAVLVLGNPGRKKEVRGNLKDSYFIFDNRTGAILGYSIRFFYRKGYKERRLSRVKKTPYIIRPEEGTRNASFVPEQNKFRIAYYGATYEGAMQSGSDKTWHKITAKMHVYVTQSRPGNTIPKKDRIDLTEKPLYQYVPEIEEVNPTILLTREESAFINAK